MFLEIKKTAIGTLCEPICLSDYQSVDADFVLPDYFDTIGKLLKCSVVPVTEAMNVVSDKISVAGCAEISFLYIGEDNKLYNYENNCKYTKNIRCEQAEATDCVNIKQEIISVNYRVLGPKRIEIRAQIRVTAEIIKSNTTEIISDIVDDSIEIRKGTFSSVCPENAAVREISLSSVNRLPENDSVRLILRKNCNVSFTELKPISNKLYLNGSVETEIYYISENDNKVRKHMVTIPLSEVVDFYGVDDTSVCDVEISQKCISVNILNAENGNSFDVRVNMTIRMISYAQKEFFYLSDVFSVNREIKASSDKIFLRKNRSFINKTVTVDVDADSYENEDVDIEDCYLDNVRVTSEINKDINEIFINGDFNVLFVNSSGMFGVLSRNSSQNLLIPEITSEKNVVCIHSSVLSCAALQGADGKIHLTADININICVEEKCKVDALTEISIIEGSSTKNNSEIILYYANKGESVWNIAKENKMSINGIKRNNSLTEEKLNDDMILLLSDF